MRRGATGRAVASITAFAGLFSAWLLPAQLVAEEARPAVCAPGDAFVNRRLADDRQENLCEQYRGKVLLVVNTASRCAFTDQYEGLEQLYGRLGERGLVVVGFPSNDFGNQEPGDEQSIQSFCRLTYGVQFPMYQKSRVVGSAANPLYQRLAELSGEPPRWNFHKYLIDRDGRLAGSYGSMVKPGNRRLVQAIESLL